MSDYWVNTAASNENVTEEGANTWSDKMSEMHDTPGIDTKIENFENIRTQRRHYPFVADNISEEVKDVIAKEIANEAIGSKAAAGIETKIENYENIRTQRQHYAFIADNVTEERKDTNTEDAAAEGETETNGEEMNESEAAAGIETYVENDEDIRTQRQHFPFTADNVSEEVKDTNGEMASEGEIEVDVEETIESEATAGVATKIENFENIRTQRRHFPGSTSSLEWNIIVMPTKFNKNHEPPTFKFLSIIY
ncbi:hypothetical protein HNY73_000485 [Argiope bruennichi]|uniref:Uncharacterized protein n=1 Tax=Argiope bruennichi TaxID=94029 RepID=A0A8T0G0T6_ARGBR|nr:hypothetical protein HNY73_000485 [Argiope bruennichi]